MSTGYEKISLLIYIKFNFITENKEEIHPSGRHIRDNKQAAPFFKERCPFLIRKPP
jgi:hypothetical protein